LKQCWGVSSELRGSASAGVDAVSCQCFAAVRHASEKGFCQTVMSSFSLYLPSDGSFPAATLHR